MDLPPPGRAGAEQPIRIPLCLSVPLRVPLEAVYLPGGYHYESSTISSATTNVANIPTAALLTFTAAISSRIRACWSDIFASRTRGIGRCRRLSRKLGKACAVVHERAAASVSRVTALGRTSQGNQISTAATKFVMAL
jgi:hypothetical protein